MSLIRWWISTCKLILQWIIWWQQLGWREGWVPLSITKFGWFLKIKLGDTWWIIRKYKGWFIYQLFKTMRWSDAVNLYSFIVSRYVIFTPVWWSCIEVIHYYGDWVFLIGYCFYKNFKIAKKFFKLFSWLARWAIWSSYKTHFVLVA